MATLSLPDLGKAFEALSLDSVPQKFNEADVLNNPLDLFRSYLAELLCSLTDCDPNTAWSAIQWPNNIFNGDLAIIVPRLSHGTKANELQAKLMEKFPQDHALFPLPIPEGVHIRIFLNPETVPRVLMPYILDRKKAFGSNIAPGLVNPSVPDSGQKRMIVEFSSPNITSEVHGKHLRSTILGEFVSRLHENMGWNVTRINYLGDWGKNIALLRVGWEKFGSEEVYQADPVSHLLDIYHKIEELFAPEQAASKKARDEAAKEGRDEGEAQVEIESQGIFAERNEAFKKLEEGDEDVVAFWKRIRDVNIDNYTDFYDQLGIKFDEYSGESQISTETMTEIEQMLKDKNISEESGGSWIVHMEKYGSRSTAIIRDRQGSSTYLLRDLAAVVERSRKYSFDKMIFVVANDYNSAHFTQVFKILEALGMDELARKLQHLKFNETSRMVQKLGRGYKPQGIIDQCEKEMKTALEADEEKAVLLGNFERDSKTMAVSALLAQELSTRTSAAHAFDTATMTTFKAATGPYLQYWYAKLCSVLNGNAASGELSDSDYECLSEEDEVNLLRVLAQYPEITRTTYHSLEPAGVVTYLASVIEQLSECFGEDEEEIKVTPGHIALYEATRVVLENGMNLLGLNKTADVRQARADTPLEE